MRMRIFLMGLAVCHLSGMTALARQLPVPIPASSAQDPADQRLGEIRGRVFAADAEYPLAKATLSLRSTGAPPQDRPRTVRTDGRGEYAFEDLEAGKYVLRARRSGYIPKNYGQKTSHSFRREGVGTSLSVGSGQVLDGVDFHLIRAGVVEGRVVDQDNEPLERVRVMLSGNRSLGGERRLLPFGRDETDDRGRFRIFGIPPGSYVLSASPRPFIAQRGDEERSFPPDLLPWSSQCRGGGHRPDGGGGGSGRFPYHPDRGFQLQRQWPGAHAGGQAGSLGVDHVHEGIRQGRHVHDGAEHEHGPAGRIQGLGPSSG